MENSMRITILHKIFICFIFFITASVYSASFDGSSYVEIDDPTGGLSWSPEDNAMTVYCWFKISIPSDVTISKNMTILVDRKDGNINSMFAYLLQYNFSWILNWCNVQ